jgi:phytoene dehydrogenase-like protein
VSGYDAVVVGGGHNGLVCAAYLAKAGLRVLVLERRERAGGAAVTGELLPGVRVPALAHTAGRLRASVIRDLRLADHGVELFRSDARVFAPQLDGRAITLWADPSRTAEELRDWSRTDAASFPQFDRKVRTLTSFMAHLHAATPPDLKRTSLPDLAAALRLGKAFRRLGPRAGREVLRALPMPVADFVQEHFETDPLRAVLAARGIQYAAMGPRSAGTTATFLADGVSSDGGAAGSARFVRGGPGALADGLAAAARSFGVDVRTGAEVSTIVSRDERVAGVALGSGEEVQAPVVVSGVDPKRTLLGLLDPTAAGPTLRWRAETLRLPGVVAKVNLVLDARPQFLGAADQDRLRGRIVVAGDVDDLERAFDASKYGRISDKPYLEATIPTLIDPTLAADGRQVMSVLVQYAPYHLREGDWDRERDGLGDLELKTLEGYAPGLTDRVVERQVITPLDLERDFAMTEGHPLHGEPSLDQFFAWRPLLGHARYRLAGIRGLYLCGSGAHPGGGLTGAPGANAAREILRDSKARRWDR